MPAFVRETSDGWDVVDGATVTPHDSQVEALTAALATYDVVDKDAVLRAADTGEPNGAWRWIHASAVEYEAGADGKRIGEQTIDEAISALNASPRARVIDGGTADSEVHGTEFTAGGTLANGWAHAAVRSVDADGRIGIYVWAEVVPELQVPLLTGRLAFASIAVRAARKLADGTMVGAHFSSLALTNQPAQSHLQPQSAIRSDAAAEVRVSSPVHLVEGKTMAKLTLRTKLGPKHLALRGPAIDKVVEVARALGVEPDAEFEADEWESPTKAAFCAIRTAALAEKILEQIPAATPAIEVQAARAAMNGAFRATLGLRAEVPDADLEALAKALGLEAGAPVADMIAAAEKLAKPAEQPPAEGEQMPAGEMDANAVRAIRAELSVLKSASESDRKELEALRAKDRARDDADWLDGEVRKRRLALRSEDRADLVGILAEDPKRGRSLVARALDTRNAPPQGQIITGSHARSADPLAEGDDGEALAKRAEALLPELRKQHPNEPEYLLVARAQKAAAKAA